MSSRFDRNPRPRQPGHQGLPRNCFGMLVGTFDHAARGSQYRKVVDDNHIYFWLRVTAPPHAGLYECAVNLASETDRLRSPVLYSERETIIPPGALPAAGFHAGVKLSYAALRLRDNDFGLLPQPPFGPSLLAHAESCLRMAVYGVTYSNGEGLHDIHLNSHEMPGSMHRDRLDEEGRPSQDGALVFYFPAPQESIRARWIFSKFATQRLTLTNQETSPGPLANDPAAIPQTSEDDPERNQRTGRHEDGG